MNETLQSILDDIRQTYGLVYGIISSSDGSILVTSGDPRELQWSGLLDALFGTPESIRRLVGSLTGQLLPREFAQGETYCFVLKPSDTYLVGLFGQGMLDPVAQYTNGQKMDQSVQQAFEAKHLC